MSNILILECSALTPAPALDSNLYLMQCDGVSDCVPVTREMGMELSVPNFSLGPIMDWGMSPNRSVVSSPLLKKDIIKILKMMSLFRLIMITYNTSSNKVKNHCTHRFYKSWTN